MLLNVILRSDTHSIRTVLRMIADCIDGMVLDVRGEFDVDDDDDDDDKYRDICDNYDRC